MSKTRRTPASAKPLPTRNEWLSEPEGAQAPPAPDEQDDSPIDAFEEEQAGIAAKE